MFMLCHEQRKASFTPASGPERSEELNYSAECDGKIEPEWMCLRSSFGLVECGEPGVLSHSLALAVAGETLQSEPYFQQNTCLYN